MTIKKKDDNTNAKDSANAETVVVDQVELDEDGMFDDEENATVETTKSEVAKQDNSNIPVNAESVGGTLSEDEMEDLEFGFGAFPIIKLNGDFECDDDEIDLEDNEFLCIIQSYKARWIYSEKTGPDETSDKFFYTYNDPKKPTKTERITTSGDPFDPILAEWKEDDVEFNVSKYLEVVVILRGENDGKIAILQVSPSSINRFSGYVAMELRTLKGLHYSKVVTRVSAGSKIKTKSNRTFKPWAFSYETGA